MNRILPLITVLTALFVVWYIAAVLMNASLQRDLYANSDNTTYSTGDLIRASLNMERPKLPAPHQVAAELYKLIVLTDPGSRRSLVYHGAITFEETVIGFAIGASLGVALAVLVVSFGGLERSLMPWIVASQTVPIIALAADDRGHPQPVRHRRPRAQGDHRRLSVVLPRHRRHGQRFARARASATRSDAHLFRRAVSGDGQAARTRQPAVPVRPA